MKSKSGIFLTTVFVISLLLFSGCSTTSNAPDSTSLSSKKQTKTTTDSGGYIDDITFKKLKGKERVSFSVSGISDFSVSIEPSDILSIKFKNVSLPAELPKEHYSKDPSANINYVSLSQKTVDGNKWVYAKLDLKKAVPYKTRKQGESEFVVDFDVASLGHETPQYTKTVSKDTVITKDVAEAIIHDKTKDAKEGKTKRYTGAKISLDFQDANIRSVFRLMSEVSGFSIVSGPNVNGNITVHMKNVPWDQALDTILEINNLGKKQLGNVITVLPFDELKKAEEEQQKKDVAQGRLRQISIEAKIVEVTTTFAKELGINWGAGGASGNFAMGISNSSSGTVTMIPSTGIGLTSSQIAVNFPSVSASAVTTPAIGLLYGTSKTILDAKLAALESTGNGKIISSPKVTTLDSVTATIKQGEEIPYTVTNSDGDPTTEFKEATLKLEVTPTITHEGRVSIKVSASNDYADWETDSSGLRIENPPINTSSVDSTVVVKDGDTIVIGGVYKMTASDTVSGVPWISNVPILGWLFKYKTVNNDKRELLIFVTPRIVKEDNA